MTAETPAKSAPIDHGAASDLMFVEKLEKRFGGLLAVDGVSFSVREGAIFGLIGPNGAGKTTLFNLITGLTPPTSGRLTFRGQNLTGAKPHVIASKGIARTFQNIRLFPNLSALENVMVAQHIHSRSNVLSSFLGLPAARHEEAAVKAKAIELLTLVNLADRAEEKAKNFSYGDQRRLEMVRALALKPQILLLDEPGAGMNANEKAGLSDFIRQIRDTFNLTVVLIEHHVPLVMGLCDRIAVLNFGQLIALGNPADVQRDPAVIEAYLGE